MRRFFAALLSCAALAALGQKMEVHVMPVDSMDGLVQWLQQKPAPTGTYPRAQQLALGKKVYLPILITGIDPSASGPVELVGDLEIVGPDGKTTPLKKCCRYATANRSGLRFAILSNAPVLEMDSGDKKGTYTLRATVTDGKQTLAGTDQIAYGTAASKAANAAPDSQRGAGKANSHQDMTRCLSLPTPKEVARCSEGR